MAEETPGAIREERVEVPTKVVLELWEHRRLAYGENRSQSPASLMGQFSTDDDCLSLGGFEVVSGDPSYISYADLDSCLQTLCLLAEGIKVSFRTPMLPHIAVLCKHGNPCGVGVDWHFPEQAIRGALLGDPLAAMGGELITNIALDGVTGTEVHIVREIDRLRARRDRWGLDLIAAPSFTDEAIEVLGGRKAKPRRLLANSNLSDPFLPPNHWMLRPVRGGYLVQRRPNFILDVRQLDCGAQAGIAKEYWLNLLIAWAVCWTASSNTVALAHNNMLIGLGCGQQDRVACVQLCLERAARSRHQTRGSVFASDAFFPFATSSPTQNTLTDEVKRALLERQDFDLLRTVLAQLDRREGPELLIAAGCQGGIVPADGMHLKEVQALFSSAGLNVGYLPPEYRGFARH